MVEWKKIEDVCKVLTGGDAPENCVKGQSKPSIENPYPVYSNGDEVYGFCSSYRVSENAVTISSIGNVGSVNFRLANFTPIIRLKVVIPCCPHLLTKFLFYNLLGYKFVGTSSSLSSMKAADIKRLSIPIPSLSEQNRIVSILDTFTSCIDNLKAQIAQRRKQYEFYRDQLLDLEGKPEKDIKLFGEVCEILKGNGVQKTDFEESGFGCIHYGQIYTHYGSFTYETNKFVSEQVFKKARKASRGDIIMTDTSENVEDICKSVAYLGEDDIAVSNHALIIKHQQNAKFLSYTTLTKSFFNQKRKYAYGVKVTGIKPEHLAKFKIFLPSLSEQDRIVSILDTFEASISNLEAQLEQRQKQYEYYRNQLLTFD